MFEAYRVGITVAVVNQGSSVLRMLARDFAQTQVAADALKGTIKDIGLLAASGALLGGLGYAGFRALSSLVKPATEYAHQLNIMNMAGLSQVEIAQAVGDAWKNTGTVMTTTATQNLRMLLDLKNVLGDMQEARAALPVVSQIQAVLASSNEGSVRQVAQDNFAFNMAKALDIVGAARSPQEFEKQAGEMAQVITAFQGRVTPAMFQSIFNYARQEKFSMGDDFKYSILPTLMLENAPGAGGQGGGSHGVGPALAAFSRLTVQGFINRKSMPELAQLGLIDPGTALQTTTSGTTVGAMKGADLAASNPFLWVQQVLMPAIEQKFGGNATPQQITSEIQDITRGNQLASQLVLEFALKSQNFLRDQAIIHNAMPYQQAYQQAMQNDPNFAYAALAAQWENLKTAFGVSVIPILMPAIMKLTGALNAFALWAENHPNMTAGLTEGFIALSAALAFSGVVLTLTAAFKALQLAMIALGVLKLGAGAGAAAAGGSTALGLGLTALGGLATAGGLAYLDYTATRDAMQTTGRPWWHYVPGAEFFVGNPWAPQSGEPDSGGSGDQSQKTQDGIAEQIANAVKSALHGMAFVMEGETVARLVTDAQARESRNPPNDSGNYDMRLSPAWPGFGGR